MRLSPEVQARYAMKPESWEWKWQVTDEVQRRVCDELGFADDVATGLDLLRSSMALFPNDKEIREAAHYLRYNIHVDCPLSLGGVVPNLILYSPDGGAKTLHEVVAKKRATVVLAGSHT